MATLTHITMQRVIVRMLFDPAFARSVIERPEESLKGLGLDARHVSFLTGPDPRVWRLDPHRRARSLEALLDEYPASAALLVGSTSQTSALDAFFSSSHFHQCIQQRQRLALAFGSYLIDLAIHLKRADLEGVTTLEKAVAAFRRPSQLPDNPDAKLHLSPNVALVSVPTGTLEAYVNITQTLAEKQLSGAAAVILSSFRLRPFQTTEQRVWVLLEKMNEGSGPGLSVLADGLASLLVLANQGTSFESFSEVARNHGADPGEEREILDSLIDDGLIIEHPR